MWASHGLPDIGHLTVGPDSVHYRHPTVDLPNSASGKPALAC